MDSRNLFDRPEHPSKLLDCAAQLRTLINQAPDFGTYDQIFWQVDRLALAEVQFYYQRRRNARLLSETLKVCTWVAGLMGVIFPQIAAAEPEYAGFRLFGSIALALAAAFGTANSMFGGSSTHIRATTAQLALELEVTTFRLQWANLASTFTSTSTAEFGDKAFTLMGDYIQAIWRTVSTETQEWGKLVLETGASARIATTPNSPKEVGTKLQSRRQAQRSTIES